MRSFLYGMRMTAVPMETFKASIAEMGVHILNYGSSPGNECVSYFANLL